MPVTRTFPAQLSLKQLVPIINSLGAHVAAKLGHFGTDERTLTDDLCDMFFTWAKSSRMPDFAGADQQLIDAVPNRQFDIEITKTTQQEEAAIGADLAVRVTSPLGVKLALMQAKVFDPQDDALRCDSPAGWDKLWAQLMLMRNRCPLSFFLIYVPADRLDCAVQGISTWEQGYKFQSQSTNSSKFGVTLIATDDLLTSEGNWCFSPPTQHVGNGQFRPAGISLCRLILEMILCRRGAWRDPWQVGIAPGKNHDSFPVHYIPYREIGISFNGVTEQEWNAFVTELEQCLENIELA